MGPGGGHGLPAACGPAGRGRGVLQVFFHGSVLLGQRSVASCAVFILLMWSGGVVVGVAGLRTLSCSSLFVCV